MEDLKRILGNNVKRERIALNLSQEDFAELCNLHRTYISDIECFRRNVSLESIEKIAKALNIKSYQLLKEEE